jgi:hypothetical protein
MAREQRKDVDYFPHGCIHGRKMHIIQKKYGNDGYASWFKLLEELGKANNHFIDISDETNLMFLSSVFDVDEVLTNEILKDLSKLGAIDKFLFENFKVIWSEKFCESIQDAYKKRKQRMFTKDDILKYYDFNPERNELKNAKKEVNPERIEHQSDVLPVNLPEVIPKEKESKVKKSKEEESKEEYTPNGVVDFSNQPDKPKIDFLNLVTFFNENRGVMPEVQKLSEARKKRIIALEKQHGKKAILQVIEKSKNSNFIQGENKEGWVGNFDWIFKPGNFIKILENNYANREKPRTANYQPTDADHKKSAIESVGAMFGQSR